MAKRERGGVKGVCAHTRLRLFEGQIYQCGCKALFMSWKWGIGEEDFRKFIRVGNSNA